MEEVPAVCPADPGKPCPIASLPEDLWFHISDYVAKDLASEFVVCTARTVMPDKNLPLSAIDEQHDHVLKGVPINGKLYITEVPDAGNAEAFLGERHLHPSRAQVVQQQDDDEESDDEALDMELTSADDNGPWFSVIKRHVGGTVNFDTTASCPNLNWPRHRFFKEETADKVRLRCSTDELHVLDERHGHSEIQTHQFQTGLPAMIARLQDRMAQLSQNDAVQYLRIPGASAVAKNGKLLVLALCRAMKIYSKLNILGVLPLMTRLDVYNPEDDLSTMTTPFNLRPQMSYSLNKWLALVPFKWISIQQMLARSGHVCSVNGVQIPTRENLQEVRRGENESASKVFDREPPLVSMPTSGGMAHPYLIQSLLLSGTSFARTGPMMVHAFFTCQNRFVNLNSDDAVETLHRRAAFDPMFQEEFSITGPHVVPALPSKALKCSKTTLQADPDGLSPELELFGGFSGV